ncbi:MAG: Crp/Fnr family transcriptional regulator [Bacteroidetes bacterium]|nr:Crp/Fnr family transcriptional regulator [Bacteroidota bacterium]
MNIDFVLLQSELFHSLKQEHRRRIAAICIPKRLKKQEILFREGDKGYAVYLCSWGAVQLFKSSPSGEDVVIKVVKPGELFGEVVLFETNRYPVSAVALESSEVFVLPKYQFECLLEDVQFRKDFITHLMKKLRYLTEQLYRVSTLTPEQRFLEFLRERYGNKTEIRVSFSKKDMASIIGITPEAFSRMLQRLKVEGILEWKGTKIIMK